MMLLSCGQNPKEEKISTDENILYKIGDSVLTINQVIIKIPQGLNPEDSASLFQNIADDWLYGVLLEQDVALNFSEREIIENQVKDYRRRLLIARYRESLSYSGDDDLLPEDSIRAIYESHKEEYKLKSPMVKGILIQMPANDNRLQDVRRWLRNPTMANIELLEKMSTDHVIRYEYFMDEWQDWRDIATLIPYKFPETEAYVASHPMHETKYKGFVYFLTITSHLISGNMMPYEKAAQIIRADWLKRRQNEADKLLLMSLKKKAIATGALKDYTKKTDSKFLR